MQSFRGAGLRGEEVILVKTDHQRATFALDKVGNEPTFETPAKFAEIIKADLDRWGPVVKQSGFVADE